MHSLAFRHALVGITRFDGRLTPHDYRRVATDKCDRRTGRSRQERHEAQLREAAKLELAGVRAAVERELRLGGAPESQIRQLVDAAMTAYHASRVVEAAERGPATEAELREFFRRRAATAGRVD